MIERLIKILQLYGMGIFQKSNSHSMREDNPFFTEAEARQLLFELNHLQFLKDRAETIIERMEALLGFPKDTNESK